MELTKTQLGIVQARGQNLLVSAGAGTGKTRVLVERFLALVMSGEALCVEILALTFTEKAAMEMKSRVLERLREEKRESAVRELESAYISTFHAFAARLLREHPVEAGIDPEFRVLESEEADFLKEDAASEVLEKAYEEHRDSLFELLAMWGEEGFKAGIFKIFEASRTAGKSLDDWFESSHASLPVPDKKKIEMLLEKADKKNKFYPEWKNFASLKEWGWEDLTRFQTWMAPFARQGNAQEKPLWKELKACCETFFAAHVGAFALPLKEKIKTFSLAFEAAYEEKKAEIGALDFSDLEMRLLRLFKRGHPANQKLLARYRQHFKFIMVDEFQDTNAVQSAIVELLAKDENLFYVGDYKQSIYGFRGTSPSHFLELERRFQDEGAGLAIPLLENFRTQGPVLDFINRFFEKLWSKEGFNFQPLIARAPKENTELKESSAQSPVTVLVCELAETESLSQGRMREARAMAERMKALHEEGISWGDMAVLFQAMTDSAIYEQAFKEWGIPFFAVSGRGFYHQPEIRDMVSFLAFLDNPLADIPLAALLRSPLFQISDDTLFHLSRLAKKDSDRVPLWAGLQAFETCEDIPAPEKEKLRFFCKTADELLLLKERLFLYELVEWMLERTGYRLAALANPQGVRRYSNLKKLVDLAREYEMSEKITIGHFIRTLQRLESYEVRESEAQIEAEKSRQVVRLMTIHAAKGLEFPVVFVADLAHKRKFSESRMFLADSVRGFSFQIENPVTGEFEKPLDWHLLDRDAKQREAEEWKRLFYVAATRAKSRLVLSGVFKRQKTVKESFSEMTSWMEWVMTLQAEMGSLCSFVSVQETRFGHAAPSWVQPQKIQAFFEDAGQEPLETLIPESAVRDEAVKKGEEVMQRIQPQALRRARVIDLPVSAYSTFEKNPEVYQRIYTLGVSAPEKPEGPLQEESRLSYADFGTRMHRVLQWIDFSNPEESASVLIGKIFKGCLETEILEARKLCAQFVNSPLGKEIASAKACYRELPFVLDERHGKIYGVMDLLFLDSQGVWRIVDYKTSEGNLSKVQASGYETQVLLYGFATRQLLKKTPAEAVIYFIKNNWEYRVPCSDALLNDFRSKLQSLQESLLP